MKSNDEENIKSIQNQALKEIKSTFGYGMHGNHKKRCELCDREYDEPNDLDILIQKGPSQCPYCRDIIRLRDVFREQQSAIFKAEDSSKTIQDNFYRTSEDNDGSISTSTYQLDDYDSSFEIVRSDGTLGRTQRLQQFIDRLKGARDYLYFRVGPTNGNIKIDLRKARSILENGRSFC